MQVLSYFQIRHYLFHFKKCHFINQRFGSLTQVEATLILRHLGLNQILQFRIQPHFFIFFVVLIVLHILVILLKKWIEYWCTRNNWRCPRKNFQWITDKCLAIMTYGYYIRFVMQMNQFLLVVSIYEVYSLNLSNIFNIVSFIFALLVLLFCLCYTGVVLYLSFSPYKLNDKGRNKIGEFFMGIKMENKYKFFITVLILRRTLFIVLLINLMSISSRFLVVILERSSL